MIRTTALAAVLMAAGLPALAAQQDFHWQGKLAAGATIEIKGTNGPIHATGTSAGLVEVSALKKAIRSDPAQVKIEVLEHEAGVTICAVYPDGAGAKAGAPCQGGRMQKNDSDVQVEFEVKVPAGVRFVGRTVNGSIRATEIQADAEAHSVNGEVELDATGAARASTVNGAIAARIGHAEWNGTLKLATVNGRILVTLPEGSSADVKASTVSGEIETDFPLTVSGHVAHHSLSGTLGSGGRLLEMSTVNGAIELRKTTAKTRVRASLEPGRR